MEKCADTYQKKDAKGGEGWEQKQLERDLSNMKKMIDLSKSATELQKPKIMPYYYYTIIDGDR